MPNQNMSDQLGVLLQNSRRRAGLTQQQLSDRSSVSVRAIRDLESGRIVRPRKETLRLLVEALRLSGPRRAALEVAAGGSLAGSTLRYLHDAELAPPTPIGPLLGRQDELRTLTDLIASEREPLLTIVGLAGVGKTRLAQEVAHAFHIRDGAPVLWVPAGADTASPVNALDRPCLLLTQWVRTLATDRASFDELAGLLGGRRALLVLDGHQAQSALGPPLLHLLNHCPELKILITTRDPQWSPGGRTLPLSPLPCPTGRDLPNGVPAANRAAVRLMLSYLSHLRPELRPSDLTVSVMAEICECLDGLPQALETAASWLLLYSPEQLLEVARTSPLSLIERVSGSNEPTGPDLGQALGESIAQLLPQQALLLRTAARLAEPWTLDTAARLSGITSAETGRAVHALVLRGLVRPEAQERAGSRRFARFSVLNLVKRQARLDAAGAGVERVLLGARRFGSVVEPLQVATASDAAAVEVGARSDR